MIVDYQTSSLDSVTIRLSSESERVMVPDFQSVISFKGNPSNVEASVSKELTRSLGIARTISVSVRGPSELILSSNNHAKIHIKRDAVLTPGFYFRNVIFYGPGINKKLVFESIKNTIFSGKITKAIYEGSGTIGFFGEGEIINVKLEKNESIYIPLEHIAGYSVDISCAPAFYGNLILRQIMNIQYRFDGPGEVIVQSQSRQKDSTAKEEEKENFVVRWLKDKLPFPTP